MPWNQRQCVECMGKHVGQDDERKREGWEEEIQERIEKNEHAYIVERVSMVLDSTAVCI